MSDSNSNSAASFLNQHTKLISVGVSSAAALLLGYFVYSKFYRESNKRNTSSLSDGSCSDENRAKVKVNARNNSPQKINEQKEKALNGQVKGRIRSGRNAKIKARKHGSKSKSEEDEIGRESEYVMNRKAIFFDSNDEMFFESEISDSDMIGAHKQYIKVKLKPTEQEKAQMNYLLSKKKKQTIQRFLNEVTEKKNSLMQLKNPCISKSQKVFKEDEYKQERNLAFKRKSNGSHTSSTQSEDAFLNQGAIKLQNVVTSNGGDMSIKNGINKQENGQRKMKEKGVVEISPEHFKDKDRSNWFGLFTAYTSRYL